MYLLTCDLLAFVSSRSPWRRAYKITREHSTGTVTLHTCSIIEVVTSDTQGYEICEGHFNLTCAQLSSALWRCCWVHGCWRHKSLSLWLDSAPPAVEMNTMNNMGHSTPFPHNLRAHKAFKTIPCVINNISQLTCIHQLCTCTHTHTKVLYRRVASHHFQTRVGTILNRHAQTRSTQARITLDDHVTAHCVVTWRFVVVTSRLLLCVVRR